MKALSGNLKTYISLDLSTNCPKRQAGNPCSYCYVETARREGFRAKLVHNHLPYNGEIKRLKQSTIDTLNECGGLRLFSFGDYMPWMDEELELIIEDANECKLMLKAITKQPEFVEKYHDKINLINVSVDALEEGMNIEVAKAFRDKYSNVKVRAAIMNETDLEQLNWVDVLTFNHARNRYRLFSKREIEQYAHTYPSKVCCETGRCLSCTVKCGA